MREFFVGLGRIAESLGNFGTDQFAEALAQAVNGDFYGGLGHAECSRSVGLRSGNIACEPRFEKIELVLFAFGGHFGFEDGERASHNFERPLTIK